MTNARRTYTQAEELALTTQVGGLCPLCDDQLFYIKKNQSFKHYQLAHIYPLNPTPSEVTELKGAVLLHSDVNHPDNLIPLCVKCHSRLDKPRTREEYEELAQIKTELIERQSQRKLIREYPLEAEIRQVIARLNNDDFAEIDTAELQLNAKSLDEKFDASLPMITQRKIRNAVTDYYPQVRRGFRDLELETPAASEVIYGQVRSYYPKQKSLGLSQRQVFENVVEWLQITTDSKNRDAPEIVASFFVQDCEVFD